ncbi:hypothetical protein PFISCL1PPCAC_8243, partial [Pristionchus fissidentatus]
VIMPKCYYELLEVERDADAETIKKSYRKMALKWHPDKNPDNIEEATKTFALLQQAYDTLSDTQERAWYDRHREQIIRGGFDKDDFKDDSIDLLQYHCKCWDGFGNEKKGFYAVYREVFETLTEEDRDFHDDHKDGNYPQFGDAASDPEEIVTKFYGFWMSFCTVRSFTWMEEYDIRQAPNRPTMKAMERENEKMRQAAKAERNEQIRDLAAFVRKKDPRVAVYKELLEEKNKESKRKTEEKIRQQRIDNLKHHGVHKESEESKEEWRRKMEEIEDELDEREGGGASDLSDEDADEEVPYCIVCEKAFKSIKTKENHDKSKAHKLKLAELRKHMKKDEQALLLEGMGEEEDGEEQEVVVDNTPRGKKSKKARKREKERRQQEEEDEEGSGEGDLAEATEGLSLEEKNEEEGGGGEKEEENIFLAAAKVPIKKEKKKGKADATITLQEPVKGGDTAPKTATCDKCGEFFESRSQLFAHLKESGHATPLVQVGGGGGKKNKNKKGKRGGNDDW